MKKDKRYEIQGTNNYYVWRKKACSAKKKLHAVNPFLAEFLAANAVDSNNHRKIGWKGLFIFIGLLKSTGLDKKMTSAEAIDANVDWFWELLDAANALKEKDDRRRGIKAVVSVYHYMNKARYLDNNFWRPDNSPYYYLCKKSFENTLIKEYGDRRHIAFIRFSVDFLPRFVIIPFRNLALREMALTAFNEWPNKHDRSSISIQYLKDSENWFEGTTDDIKSYRDLTASMLVTARDHILKTTRGKKERREKMWFLFFIFGTQVRKHPGHHFFRESPVWDAGMISDKRVANHMADGFSIAFYGQETPFLQGHGTLLICDHASDMSASSVVKRIVRVDLRTICDPILWDAGANFCLHSKVRDIAFVKVFLQWLIGEKEKDRGHITKADVDEFRAYVSRRCVNGTARNVYIAYVTKFLRFAQEEKFLQVDSDALKDFYYFNREYIPKPKPHTKVDIQRLLVTLDEMAKVNPVYTLIRIMVSILCTESIRAGQLCVINLRNLTFNLDGTATLHAKTKNGGPSRVAWEFRRETADRLHEALVATEDIRRQCPIGTIENQLFIFRNTNKKIRPFMSMTIISFNSFLKNACEVAGIPAMPSGSLRDTFFSAFLIYADQNGLSDLERQAITRHKSSSTIGAYAKPDIREILKYTETIERNNI